jgi:hypothetical protein
MRTTMGVAIALAAVLASPAFAKDNTARRDAYGAYAQQVQSGQQFRSGGRWHSANSRWDVYNTEGHYLGSDPDPRVRQMLANDPSEGHSY